MKLPEYVLQCGLCKGKGQRRQNYNLGCGQGMIKMEGRCDECGGTGYRNRHDLTPVSPSVLDQIKNMNK